MPFKFIAGIFLAVAAAATLGWLAGGSGRSTLELERDRNRMRAEFAEARASAMAGRISVSESNYGDAMQQFQNARALIGRLQSALRGLGQMDQAGRLEIAVSHLSDAQRAASAFKPDDAEAAADAAVKALTAAGGG